MIARFLDFITKKGASNIERKADFLTFKYNNHFYIFSYDPQSDSNFIRLILPDIEPSDTIDESVRKTMIEVSTEYKVIKVVEVEEKVWLSAELFVFSTENIDVLFQRILDLMENALNIYHEKRKEQSTVEHAEH